MRSKTLLAAFLLGAGLCFVPALGYGEEMDIDQLRKELAEDKVSRMRVILLEAKVDYMMTAPTTFLRIDVGYDRLGLMRMAWELPEGIARRVRFVYRSEIIEVYFLISLEWLC